VTVVTTTIGDVRLTRIGYADVTVPAAAAGLTPADVPAVEWAAPLWADGDQVRAGAAAWVIEHDRARIVVDPALAADDVLRGPDGAVAHQEAFAAAMEAAGFARDTITHAVATHLDGIGMFAWRDGDTWTPFFPNAPLYFSRRELDDVDRRPHAIDVDALATLRAKGAVEATTGERTVLSDAVSIVHTGGHSPGHQVLRVERDGDAAVVLGHLTVSPLGLAREVQPRAHVDHPTAQRVLRDLRDSGALLIGPLWPTPGAGRWRDDRLAPLP
jgi:glyoxylase-like metal-dependent hydrolase (beta-lactamase superfamily II)